MEVAVHPGKKANLKARWRCRVDHPIAAHIPPHTKCQAMRPQKGGYALKGLDKRIRVPQVYGIGRKQPAG